MIGCYSANYHHPSSSLPVLWENILRCSCVRCRHLRLLTHRLCFGPSRVKAKPWLEVTHAVTAHLGRFEDFQVYTNFAVEITAFHSLIFITSYIQLLVETLHTIEEP